ASSTTCPPAMDELAAATKARPTQSYYVPRPILEHQEKKETSPKQHKKIAPIAQLYTPPHSRASNQMPSSTSKPRPLMDIQIEKTSLFAPSPSDSCSDSSRKSPDQHRKSPEIENRRRNKPKVEEERKKSAEQRTEMFPKIIPVPSSSTPSSSRKSTTPPREGFGTNLAPPPPTPAAKDGCICDREKTHVACKRCGYECTGRLSIVCPLHPMQMNLMDLTACPNPLCHSVQLYEVPADAAAR
ncbi:hypothetical protein PFISCL1PPCAC_9772, partial [Pristionchus fissidentatus]